MTKTAQRPQFGDIYFADLIGGNNLQKGHRPVLIAQNNVGNRYSSTFEVLPLSSQICKARHMPTHVMVHANPMNGLQRDSIVLAEQVVTIHIDQIGGRLGKLDHQSLVMVGKARAIQSPFPVV
ncbi:MAG: type II toxin-antitoxin system PemK/MazF family toxin [Lachnospiraceae bacterium]|nr:type II toxin-antitoxin system PemK/MazF family toxin [Lachnospiraceae bacterium]